MLALFIASFSSPSLKFTCALVVFILYGATQEQHQSQSWSQSKSQKQEQSILISCILILFGDKSAALPMLFVWSRIYVCSVCTYIKIFATFGLSHFHGSCSHKNREEKTNKNKAAASQRSLESLALDSSAIWSVVVAGFGPKCFRLNSGLRQGPGRSGTCGPTPAQAAQPELAFSHDPRRLVKPEPAHSCWGAVEGAGEEAALGLLCCLGRDRNYKFHNGKAG